MNLVQCPRASERELRKYWNRVLGWAWGQGWPLRAGSSGRPSSDRDPCVVAVAVGKSTMPWMNISFSIFGIKRCMIFNQYHCNARYRGETIHEVVKPYMDEWPNYRKIVEWKRQQGDWVKGRISYFLKEKSDKKSEREKEKVRETKK